MPPAKHTRRIRWHLHEWPSSDQAAWSAAIADGDVLDGRGAAAHWRPATRDTNIHHYGRWLAFLADAGRPMDGFPTARVTRQAVRAYVEHLRSQVAPQTALSMVVGLKVMAPNVDWNWLADLCNAMRRYARPSVNKDSKTRPSEEIYAAAVAEMQRLLTVRSTEMAWLCGFRDALMVAFLVCRPLRLGNFVGLQLGRHLLRHQGGWVISIPGEEAKNHQPLEFDLTPSLVPHLEFYIAEVRPLISKSQTTSNLWVAWQRSALSYISAYFRITQATRKLLEVEINPHMFRHCAATSMSLVSPGVARAAAPLLGHRSFETTQKHYVRARQLDASRSINAVLASLKTSAK